MRFRFVHAADLHLDTPVAGVHRVPPFVAEVLRDASLQAFDALVALALAREAAFVLLAGDVYDGPRRGVRAQVAFRRGLERLSRAGIATLVVAGNHDPHGGWPAVRAWPAGVTLFGSREVGAVPVACEGRLLATISGLSYASPRVEENLARRFSRAEDPGLRIGLLHADVGGSPGGGSSPCSLDDLRAAGMDYWALGHAHDAAVLSARGPLAAYPGTLQGRGPARAERGAKGALVVEVSDGRVLPPEFVALDRVRFAAERVDVGGVATVAELTQTLAEVATAQAAAADGRSVVLQVTLVGTGPVVRELRVPGTLAGVVDGLRDAAPGAEGEPFLWWDGVGDDTRVARDRTALRRREDFPGALLKAAEELAADPPALHAFADRHLAALPPQARDEVSPDLAAADHPDRLGVAADLALDALLTDGR